MLQGTKHFEADLHLRLSQLAIAFPLFARVANRFALTFRSKVAEAMVTKAPLV